MHEFSGIVNAFIKHMFDTSNQSHLEGDGVRKKSNCLGREQFGKTNTRRFAE